MSAPSDPRREFRHDKCKPFGQWEHLWCDCPCHDGWD